MAKLNALQVSSIRECQGTHTQRELANIAGCTEQTICKVINGKHPYEFGESIIDFLERRCRELEDQVIALKCQITHKRCQDPPERW